MNRIVCSTLAAETIASVERLESAVHISLLLKELYSEWQWKFTQIVNLCMIHYDPCVSEKHLKVHIGRLKEMLQNVEIHQICWANKQC